MAKRFKKPSLMDSLFDAFYGTRPLKGWYCDWCERHYRQRKYAENHESYCKSNPDRISVELFKKRRARLEREQEQQREIQTKQENKRLHRLAVKRAEEREKHLDYDGAITIYEEIGDKKSAKRVRKLKADLAAPKTVVQGDYVDDRDTIVKDSIINRSNVGSGGKTKGERIKLIKELLDSGAIDKDEFKQMKKEILGK